MTVQDYQGATWIEPGHFRLGSYEIFRQIIKGRQTWEIAYSPTGATLIRRRGLSRAIAWISEHEATS